MGRVAELVRGRLVDRHGPRTGGGVGLLAGVDLSGLEAPAVVAHGPHPRPAKPDLPGRISARSPRAPSRARTGGRQGPGGRTATTDPREDHVKTTLKHAGDEEYLEKAAEAALPGEEVQAAGIFGLQDAIYGMMAGGVVAGGASSVLRNLGAVGDVASIAVDVAGDPRGQEAGDQGQRRHDRRPARRRHHDPHRGVQLGRRGRRRPEGRPSSGPPPRSSSSGSGFSKIVTLAPTDGSCRAQARTPPPQASRSSRAPTSWSSTCSPPRTAPPRRSDRGLTAGLTFGRRGPKGPAWPPGHHGPEGTDMTTTHKGDEAYLTHAAEEALGTEVLGAAIFVSLEADLVGLAGGGAVGGMATGGLLLVRRRRRDGRRGRHLRRDQGGPAGRRRLAGDDLQPPGRGDRGPRGGHGLEQGHRRRRGARHGSRDHRGARPQAGPVPVPQAHPG